MKQNYRVVIELLAKQLPYSARFDLSYGKGINKAHLILRAPLIITREGDVSPDLENSRYAVGGEPYAYLPSSRMGRVLRTMKRASKDELVDLVKSGGKRKTVMFVAENGLPKVEGGRFGNTKRGKGDRTRTHYYHTRRLTD